MNERSILSLENLADEEIDHLLDLAGTFREEGIPETHPGRFVCGLFFNPSLRTRTSLEIATASLGAHCVIHDVGRDTWSLEHEDGAVMDGDKSEHVRDAVGKFLSGAVDCLGVRNFEDHELVAAIAEASAVPVINLETRIAHPMQGLSDLLVLRNHLKGTPADHTIALTWAYHPKPLPMAVANTALLAFCRAGYRVKLVHPEGYDLNSMFATRAKEYAGDRLTVHHDMDEGLAGANVIYAKSWGAVSGAPSRIEHRGWIVDERRQALGVPGAFMHCLPVRRNVVVSDAVLDGPHSWVAEQSRSRVFTQAAVLHELL